jgi:preprotein translocase subunit SecD
MFSDIEQSKLGPEKYVYLYAIRWDSNALSNKYITKARAENDFATNKPSISFQFDAAGTKRWERMTERNIGKPIAMCINDKVISAPSVLAKIEGGSCILALGGNMETSRIIRVLLTSEDLLLPVQITTSTISEENLSPIEKLSPFTSYLVAFAAAFALSFCITWFIFKPGKKARANP